MPLADALPQPPPDMSVPAGTIAQSFKGRQRKPNKQPTPKTTYCSDFAYFIQS